LIKDYEILTERERETKRQKKWIEIYRKREE